MASPLTYPYAYDEELKKYFAPRDPGVRPHHQYKAGYKIVTLVRAENRQWHFREAGSSSGGGGPETMAHVFGKKFYQDRMEFYATIKGQRILIRFAKCEAEQRLDERTPDLRAVVGECWPPFFAPGSLFLIEIHCTNAIHQNAGRQEALERMGFPCVEVTLPEKAVSWKFDPVGDPDRERTRFENYMTAILQDPRHVKWIFPVVPPLYRTSGDVVTLRDPKTLEVFANGY